MGPGLTGAMKRYGRLPSNGDNGEKRPQRDANRRICVPSDVITGPRGTMWDSDRQNVSHVAAERGGFRPVSSVCKSSQVCSTRFNKGGVS
jgi:hypothetical protein